MIAKTKAKPMAELISIQPTIHRLIQMLAKVIHADVELVDAKLTRIAGTGIYENDIGFKRPSSRLLNYIIETREAKVLPESSDDPRYEHEQSPETAFIGVPILAEQQCLGVICLTANSEPTQQLLLHSAALFCEYVQHIAQLIVAKLTETSNQPIGLEKVFINLIDNMDQGVLVLGEDNSIIYANEPALFTLQLTRTDLTRLTISIRCLAHGGTSMECQQHILAIEDREALLVGQFYNDASHKLFLMSFYQPHIPEISYESNSVFGEVIGESEQMRRIKTLMSRIAPSPSSVLINGESGTGKEVIANAIHKLSKRTQHPFIAINCAAIPDQLLESELFGYTKGAFTGASSKGRVGLIQAADKGTLFLDEIGDMSLQLQAKLLRVLESREVMPVGSNTVVPVDIRIISATNRNFAELIKRNEFREDLYYRLNVIPIFLPTLNERTGDIHLLVNYFMDIHTQRLGVAYPGMTQETLDCLNIYPWPGNVRELSNLVEYLINIVPEGDQITADLLPPQFEHLDNHRPPLADRTSLEMPTQLTSKMSLEMMEKQQIEDAINRLNSRQAVADELGIGIATLYRKIKKYGL